VAETPGPWPPVPSEYPQAGPDTHSVQAAAEGVVLDDGDRIEFLGEKFRLADRIGLMPMLAFAAASKKGLDSEDMEGLAAMYALIRDVVDQTRPVSRDANGQAQIDGTGAPVYAGPSEWMRFEDHAIEQQAEGEELMEFVSRAMEVVSARPRRRRELSSGTSPQTSPKSRADSSSPGTPAQIEGLTRVADLGR
jgi:hypothetical protein